MSARLPIHLHHLPGEKHVEAAPFDKPHPPTLHLKVELAAGKRQSHGFLHTDDQTTTQYPSQNVCRDALELCGLHAAW